MARKLRRFLLIFLASIGIYLTFGEHGLWRMWRLKRKERELKKEVAEIEARRKVLEEEMKRLREGDPKLIEKLARERYGMVKPGEKIYIILPPPEVRK